MMPAISPLSLTLRTLVACICCAVCGNVAAQEPVRDFEVEATGQPVRVVGPDTYLLLDDEGNPQPFLNIPYEQFMEAWQRDEARVADAQQPRFVITALSLEGSARGSYASLAVRVSVLLLSDRPVQVPLAMQRAVLSSSDIPADGDNPADSVVPAYLAKDATGRGLVAWLHGSAGQERTLEFEVLVPIEQIAGASLVRLALPRATQSDFALTVADRVAEATTSRNAVLTRSAKGDHTTLNVSGAAGEFELRWTVEPDQNRELSTILRSSGSIIARIDGRRVRTEAQLTVQGFGGSFDRFHVRLPPQAVLTGNDLGEPTSAAQPYVISQVAKEQLPFESAGEWLLVRLNERQPGPVDVALTVEQPLGIEGAELAAELGGFEVHEAFRQFGDIVLAVDDDWQVEWDTGDYVRQVSPADSTAPVELHETATRVATLQYTGQPWSLPIRVLPQRPHVHVTPRYRLAIFPDEAQLRVELNYRVPAGRAFEFRTRLNGWDEITSPVDSGGLSDDAVQTAQGDLLLRLQDAAPRSAQVVWQARQGISPQQDRIAIQLPEPVADAVGTGELEVLVAPDLAVVPDLSQVAGLNAVVQTAASTVLPEFEGFERLAYRTFLASPKWAATRRTRQRQTFVTVSTEATIDNSSARVACTLQYRVKFQPLGRLQLRLPAELVEGPQPCSFELLTGRTNSAPRRPGSDLELIVLDDAEVGSNQTDQRTIELILPQPRMGEFQVRTNYAIENTEENASDPWNLELETIQPVGTDTVDHSARLVRADNTSLEFHLDQNQAAAWRIQPSEGTQAATARLVAGSTPSPLPLRVVPRTAIPAQTVVDRAWLQLWLAPDARQTRAVYQFRTNQHQLPLELPAQVALDEVLVRLNGQLVELQADESGPITVQVDNAFEKAQTIELLYRQPTESGLYRRQLVAVPVLAVGSNLSQVYWQIVLPRDEILLGMPAGFTPDWTWHWFGRFWDRKARLTQPDLEQWSGATAHMPLPSGTQTQLFRSLMPRASIDLSTSRRWVVVLVASAAALMVGLLIANVPMLRSAKAIAVLGFVVLVCAASNPGLSLFILQLSALGIGLAGFSFLLRYISTPRAAPVSTGGGAATVGRPSASAIESAARPSSVALTTTPSTGVRSPDLPV